MKRTKQLLAFAILAVAVWTAWSPLAKSSGFSGDVWYAKCITTSNTCGECIAWIGISSTGDDVGTSGDPGPDACFVGTASLSSTQITTNICVQDQTGTYYCIQNGNVSVSNPCPSMTYWQCSPWYDAGERCNTEPNDNQPTPCSCSFGGSQGSISFNNLPSCGGSGILP
jgi:hypothetical protein